MNILPFDKIYAVSLTAIIKLIGPIATKQNVPTAYNHDHKRKGKEGLYFPTYYLANYSLRQPTNLPSKGYNGFP